MNRKSVYWIMSSEFGLRGKCNKLIQKGTKWCLLNNSHYRYLFVLITLLTQTPHKKNSGIDFFSFCFSFLSLLFTCFILCLGLYNFFLLFSTMSWMDDICISILWCLKITTLCLHILKMLYLSWQNYKIVWLANIIIKISNEKVFCFFGSSHWMCCQAFLLFSTVGIHLVSRLNRYIVLKYFM